MEQAIASLRTRGLNLKREWSASTLAITCRIQTVLPKLGEVIHFRGLRRFSSESLLLFSVKIQSVANIAMPVDSQFADSSNRMLKLEMTDGAHTCYAIEYSPIPALSVSLQKGYKVCVRNVRVVNRLWLLNASNTLFLGGH
ncbi:hypothetical protein BLSTO_00527 [Blastocystis sp. subtype 1]